MSAKKIQLRINEVMDRIRKLENDEIMVETNEGTFGVHECQRAVGTGDSRYGIYSVYVSVASGVRRNVGCDPERAPGRARKSGYALLRAAQKELQDLRTELKTLREELTGYLSPGGVSIEPIVTQPQQIV